MKPRKFAPRVLAVVLSTCLILPPPAYALRPQQREAEPQLAGLEEALRSGDPDALIRVASSRLAQWLPAPASAPAVSLVPTPSESSPTVSGSGLEEEEKDKALETYLRQAEVAGGLANRWRWLTGGGRTLDALVQDYLPQDLVPELKGGLSPLLDRIERESRAAGKGWTWVDGAGGIGAALREARARYPSLRPVLNDGVRWTEQDLPEGVPQQLREEAPARGVKDLWSTEKVNFVQGDLSKLTFEDPEQAPLQIVTVFEALNFFSDPLGTLVHLYNQLPPGGYLMGNLAVPTQHPRTEAIVKFYREIFRELKVHGIRADLKVTDARSEAAPATGFKPGFQEFQLGIVLKKGPEFLHLRLTPQPESFLGERTRPIQYQVVDYAGDKAHPFSYAGLEEIKVGNPKEWKGVYGVLGKVRPLTLGGKGVGRAVFPDMDRVKLVSFFNPAIADPHYPRWQNPPIQNPEQLERLHRTGLKLEEWKEKTQEPPPGLEGARLTLLSNSFQTNFHQLWGFLVVDGKMIRQAYAQKEYPLEAERLSEQGYDEALWAFVLEPGPPRVAALRFDRENQPIEELVDIRIEGGRPVAAQSRPAEVKHAISGVPLVLRGKDVSSQIRNNAAPSLRDLRPNEVVWPPASTEAAFSALGVTADGELVLAALTAEGEVDRMALLLLEMGVTDAVLLEGSAGLQQWMHDGDPPILQAEARQSSTRYGKGRPLNAVLAFYELPRAGLEEVEQAVGRWFGPKSTRADEEKLAQFLASRGEEAIDAFARFIEQDRGLSLGSLGPYRIPPFDPKEIPSAGLFSAGLPIPSTPEAFEMERLRLMAEVAIQRALGRRIVVNVGIGFVGATVMIANSQGRVDLPIQTFSKPLQFRAPLQGKGQSPYFVVGFQRPSTESYFKIEYVNQGRAPITTADPSIGQKLKSARRRGNIRATFLKEAVSVADIALVDTELHVRKLVPRHLELSRADPGPTLKLLRQVGALVPKEALIIVETTVYPGFTLYDALPVLNEALRERGLLREGEDARLAYTFQRVEPGPRLFRSLMSLERVGAGVTPEAREGLRRYYETVGFNYQIWDEVTAVELLKDVENAYRFGLIELMGAFLRGAELAGVNAFEVIDAIASARPETHGTIRFAPALQVGGYCIPKELVMVMWGLQSHFGLSELKLKEIFFTRLASAVASDFRAEQAVYRLLESFAQAGLTMDESTILWLGVAYNPGVADTRYSGTERGLRLAAHDGVHNEVTDPYVRHWPEVQQQRLGDPESWGYGLLNQEGLKEVKVQTTENPYETIHSRQDAIVLATRHPQYVGQGQPDQMRTFGSGPTRRVYPGLDPVRVAARVMGREGKVILDSFNFLSDQDIKKFLALGWKVVGFGKGHINRLAEQVTVQERRETTERLLKELIRLRGEKEVDGEELEEAIQTIQEKVQSLRVLDQHPQDAQEVRLTEAGYQLAKARQERRYAKPGQVPLAEAKVRLAEARFRRSAQEEKDASQQVEELTRQRNEVVLKNAQKVLIQPAQGKVQELFRNAASLMEAFRFAGEERSLVVPQSVQQAVQIAESLLYLRDRAEELALDVDRAFEELVTPGGKAAAAAAMRKARARPELAFPEKQVAVVYAQDEDGKLRRKVDPEGYPNRLSVKTIKDMAKGKRNIPQGRSGDEGDWTKYTRRVPLNLVPAEDIELEAYPDFQELPWEFRHWLLTEVIGKGYVLSTMEGIPQDKFGYEMDLNLDPKTWARGRGGILFFADTRQPLTIATEQGKELIVDIKAVGPYQGGDPKTLGLSFERVTSTGMVPGGAVGRMQVGQVAGHMSSAEEIPRLHRLTRTEEAHQGQAPRPLFRIRWRYKDGPNMQFQMVARASPTNQRIGQIFIGGDEDFNPAQVARIMGENAARVLTQPIAGVHEGLNGDNIMATGHYTDLAGQIDLFNERDPFGAFYKYFGFYPMLVIYSFEEISKGDYSQPDVRFVQDWLNGFFDRFLPADRATQVRNPYRFKRFYQMGNQLGQPNIFIEDLIKTVWEQYLPYRLLKNRLEYGYDPTEESTYSTGSLETISHPESEKAVRKFIEDQRQLLQIAQRLATPVEKGGEGYDPLEFDFSAAYRELDAKARRIEEIAATNPPSDQPAYAEIYRLSFYPPKAPEIYPVISDIKAMTRGEEAVRLVMKVAEPTIFFDKADITAQAQLAARKARELKAPGSSAGLEEHPLHEIDLVSIPGAELTVAGLTDQGSRLRQEDAHLVLPLGRAGQKPIAYLAAVADGMGGESLGDLASRQAIDEIKRQFQQERFLRLLERFVSDLSQGDDPLLGGIQAEGIAAIHAANAQVIGLQRHPAGKGSRPGTTIAVALVVGPTAFTWAVGDSRIYNERAGKMELLTQDSSVAWGMALGLIQEERFDPAKTWVDPTRLEVSAKARGLPDENALEHYLGISPSEGELEISSGIIQLHPQDQILLVSDGVTHPLPDAVIAQVLGIPGLSVKERVRRLVALAREWEIGGLPPEVVERLNKGMDDLGRKRLGRDNMTAVVLKVEASAPLSKEVEPPNKSGLEESPSVVPIDRMSLEEVAGLSHLLLEQVRSPDVDVSMEARVAHEALERETRMRASETLASVQGIYAASETAQPVVFLLDDPATWRWAVPVAQTGAPVAVLTDQIARASGLEELFEAAGIPRNRYAVISEEAFGGDRQAALKVLQERFSPGVSFRRLPPTLHIGEVEAFLREHGVVFLTDVSAGLEEVEKHLQTLA